MEENADQAGKTVFEPSKPEEVKEYLADEIFKALRLGKGSLWRKMLNPVIYPAIQHFLDQGTAFDQSVARIGFSAAARERLELWSRGLAYEGQEDLPMTGPLLIAANHPGTFDSLAIAAALPRPDLKIVTSPNPFFRALPNARHYFIYSGRIRETYDRMMTIRNAISHLRGGGALIIFPSGRLEPDPVYFPEPAKKALQTWSKSIELMLRKSPFARLVIATCDGFIAPEYMNHPLALLQIKNDARQKLAEFIQVIRQVAYGHPASNIPRVRFSAPMTITPSSESWPEEFEQLIASSRSQTA